MNAKLQTLGGAALSEEELGATRVGWMGLAVVLGMCALFLLWSNWAPLAATAVAQGVVKSDRNRRVVQHQEGGMVSEIKVRDGERVATDQVLIVLGDPIVRSELRKVQSMLESEVAKLARLDAERLLLKTIAWPRELRDKKDPSLDAVLERERRVFEVRRRTLESQVSLIRVSAGEVGKEIEALLAQSQASAQASKKMGEELASNEKLVKEGFVQKNRITALERAFSEYQMKYNEALAELAKARQKKADLELKVQTVMAEFTQTANSELKQSTDRIEQLRAQLEPNADAARRQNIKAPMAGRVVEMKVNTVGAVIPPRETILEIVPENTPLVIEGRLRTDAIVDVTTGTPAGVRLLAFDQRTMPVLSGKVTYISPDRQVDKATGEPYYTISVEVSDESLREAGIEALLPGMPAELYLRAGDRTALSYLIDPFTRRMSRAITDR